MSQARKNIVPVRLGDDELWVLGELARRNGGDNSNMLRQGFLKMAREEGIELPTKDELARLKKKKPSA